MGDTLNKETLYSESDLSITDEMKGQYLTFWTDKQLYGVPISDVVQIVGIQEITDIPDFPEYAKGIINLRGSIIPIIDVRLRFHKTEIPYNERTCIIVTNIDDLYVGFIVDAVDEVADIGDDNISAPPKVTNESTSSNAYLTGIAKLDNRVVLILDTSKMLSEKDMSSIKENSVDAE